MSSPTKRVNSPAPTTAPKSNVSSVAKPNKDSKKDNRFLFVLVSVLCLIFVGLAMLYYTLTNPTASDKVSKIPSPPGVYLALPEIKTNLNEGSGVIQATFTADLSYDKTKYESDKEALEDIRKYLPMISNAAIASVSSATFKEIRANGPEFLQKRVKKAINKELKQAKVTTKVEQLLIQDILYQE